MSAEQGNQYAQYTLGKLYLTGEDVTQDREQAWRWFCESASQGNEYAQFFLEHFNDTQSQCAPLGHQAAPPPGPDLSGQLRAACRSGGTAGGPKAAPEDPAKKIAMGHKPDDHEDLELDTGRHGRYDRILIGPEDGIKM